MKTLTRRTFIATSGAATTAAAAAGFAGLTRPAAADGPSAPKNLIYVLVSGGWDPTYSIDPKPGLTTVDVPAGGIQPFGDLPVFVDDSRPNVTAFFERYAANTAVINGIHIRSIVHPDCMRRILTGTASDANPDAAAITGYELGAELPVPYLALAPQVYPGYLAGITANVGLTKQIGALLDPQAAYPQPGGVFSPGADDEAAIREFVLARAERQRATRGAHGYNQARIDDFVRSLESGDLLRASADSIGSRGLTLGLDQQLELAVDSIQNGLCQTVATADGSQWDTHGDNSLQAAFQEGLFASLTTLADDLAGRPGKSAGSTMLDETVIAVISELTRTPKLNERGGKDHWPYGSVMVLGGGVAGGRAYGGTDDEQVGLAVDLETGDLMSGGDFIQTDNFVAGLLELVGVDPTRYLDDTPPLRGFIA